MNSVCCYSVAKLCPTLCDPTHCSTPVFPVFRCLLEFAQTHVSLVNDAIQPSHPLSSPSSLAFSLSLHQISSNELTLHQVAKVLELQLQHQSFCAEYSRLISSRTDRSLCCLPLISITMRPRKHCLASLSLLPCLLSRGM